MRCSAFPHDPFRRHLIKKFHLFFTVVLALALPMSAAAQNFPQRLVRIVSPYPVGGTGGVVGSMLAERLQQIWGQPVIMETKAGAGGVIGATFVARSPPDGHTLVLIDNGPITVAPHTAIVSMSIDPMKELVPVVEVIQLAPVVAVRKALGINSMKELAATIKAKPGTLTNAVSAQGGYVQLASSALAKMAGGSMMDVPYQGAGPALMDFMGGRVDVMLVALNVVAQYESQGSFKIVGVVTESPIDLRPDLPTVNQVLPLSISAWFGLFAPAGTPDNVLEKINRDVTAVLNEPAFEEFRKKNMMLKAKTSNRKDFVEKVRADYAIWGRLAREIK